MIGLLQNAIGWCYDSGMFFITNHEKAVEWYRLAAENNDVNACKNLAICYLQGEGIEKNAEEAIRWLEKAAHFGDCNAIMKLGRLYKEGKEIPQNHFKAYEWYLKAAQLNNKDAQNILGVMLEQGEGVDTNIALAIEWYTKGANQNSAEAQFNLAEHFRSGEFVERNHHKAFELYLKAATHGIASAQFKVGLYYQHGIGGAEKNDQASMEWMLRAAEQNHAEAQYQIAEIYRMGTSVHRCMTSALIWYQKAAENNHLASLNALAVYYSKGIVVEKDDEKGFEYLKKAADLGESFAQLNIAFVYCLGLHNIVAPDPAKAFLYFHLSAVNGENTIAMSYLARCYHMGFSCDKNMDKAAYYYRLSLQESESDTSEHEGQVPSRNDLILQLSSEPVWAYHIAVITSDAETLKHLWMKSPRSWITCFYQFDFEQVEIDERLCGFLYQSLKDLPTDEAPCGLADTYWYQLIKIKQHLNQTYRVNKIKPLNDLIPNFKEPYTSEKIDQFMDIIQKETGEWIDTNQFNIIISSLYRFWMHGLLAQQHFEDHENLYNLTKVIVDFAKPHIDKLDQQNAFYFSHLLTSSLTLHKANIMLSARDTIKPWHLHELISQFENNSPRSDAPIITDLDTFIGKPCVTFRYNPKADRNVDKKFIEMKRIMV